MARSLSPRPAAAAAAGAVSCLLLAVAGAPARAQDVLGVWFDDSASADTLVTAAGPQVVRAHLLLLEPSAASGVSGWECEIEVEGEGVTPLAWELRTGLNIAQPPRFQVGIGPFDILYPDPVVSLASFTLFVPGPEVTGRIYLHPYTPASLQDPPGSGHPLRAPVYAAGGDPGDLRPLAIASGDEALPVAVINPSASQPVCHVSARALEFGRVVAGDTRDERLTVANVGGGVLEGTVGAPDHAAFAVVAGGGAYALGPGQTHVVTLRYAPDVAGDAAGTLAACGAVALHGTGFLPGECTLSAPSLDFGEVGLGRTRCLELVLHNDSAGLVTGVAAASGDGFALAGGGGVYYLDPGAQLAVTVCFTAASVGPAAGNLDLGGLCGTVPLVATGVTLPPQCETSASLLDLGTVPVGGWAQSSFVLRNTGGGILQGTVAIAGEHFALAAGGGPFALAELESRLVTVRYAPLAPGAHEAVVDAGTQQCVPVVCRGEAVPACELSTTLLDFGSVPVLSSRDLELRIDNLASAPLSGVVASDSPHFTVVAGGGAFTLPGGQHRLVSVRFVPVAPGAYAGTITTGNAGCGDVRCAGTSPVPACVLSTDALDFGEVPRGGRLRRTFMIGNLGPGRLRGQVVSPDPRFRVAGAAAYDIAEGAQAAIGVDFVPDAAGPASCVLDAGAACGGVSCAGTGIALAPQCAVSPTVLDFGDVAVGDWRNLALTIRNDGGDTLSGAVSVAGPEFRVSGDAGYRLAWREQKQVVISFWPGADSTYATTVNTGDGCAPVVCGGRGRAAAGPSDVLGIYFDPDGVTSERATSAPYEPVQAYLVLLNPSAPGGVSGWECCVEMVGGFVGSSWTLFGGALNVDAPPCFEVGLPTLGFGAGAPAIALARVDFLQLGLTEATLLYIHPYRTPSLPGVPVYADGADPGHLIPLHWPGAGEDEPVATVNGGGAVPVFAPAPAVECAEGGVRVAWAYDPVAADGCVLYRREGGAAAATAVAGAVSDPSGRVSLLDPAPHEGEALRYHYVLLRAGAEVARSAESEVTCASLPPAGTALHPVFPNPFNPRANVRFDLARPGRARVTVHDAAGRRLRVLCDGDLPAATHQREWDGRDERGRPQPSGTYYVRLEADGARVLRKVTLLR